MTSGRTIAARRAVLLSARLLAHNLRAGRPIGPMLERIERESTALEVSEACDTVLDKWRHTPAGYAPPAPRP